MAINDDTSTIGQPSIQGKPRVKKGIADMPDNGAPPDFSDVSSNGGATSYPTATSQSGSPLGIGQMVNGISTFSDGSIPGTPKTISDADMKKLIASSAAPAGANPSQGGGITSSAIAQNGTGGTYPDPTQMQPINALPQGYDPSQAAREYQSNLADIVNKDPRSVSGTAAWNAAADRVWDRNTGPQSGRAGAENQQLANAIYAQKLNALNGMPQNVFAADNQAGNDNARNQSQYGIAGLANNARLAASEARNQAMMYGYNQRADATRYSADARGDALRDVATTRANTPKVDAAQTAALGRIFTDQTMTDDQKHKAASDFIASLPQWGAGAVQGSQQQGGNQAQPATQTPAAPISTAKPVAYDSAGNPYSQNDRGVWVDKNGKPYNGAQ